MRRFVLAVSLLAALAMSAQAQEAAQQPPAPPQAPVQAPQKQDISSYLQDISVTIVSRSAGGYGGSEGSGVIKTRTLPSGESVNFIWTAAHVVNNLRHTKDIVDSKSGARKTVVEFDDPLVVKALVEDGRMVGKTEFYAEVIRYSADEDLALLRVRKKNFVNSSARFYLDEQIPPIGTKLLHVGSLLGQLGSNSMTDGIMSQHGRLVEKKVFDQTTVVAFPGSSGGGVYTEDGRLVGLVLRGAGETFNLIAPVRRIHAWAKRAGIEWAVDDKLPVPAEEELNRLPVEDNGVDSNYSPSAPGASPEHPHASKLLIRQLSDCDCGEKCQCDVCRCHERRSQRSRPGNWIRIQSDEENLY